MKSNKIRFIPSSYDFSKAAKVLNNQTYDLYLQRLSRLAMTIFEWHNLPDGMNERWLERSLLLKGTAAILKDETLGFINTNASTSSNLNMYGLPSKIHCYSLDEYNKDKIVYYGKDLVQGTKAEEYAVLVLANIDYMPTIEAIQMFAWRLTNAERTIDVNLSQQKHPYLIITDEKQRLTMQNLYRQVQDNVPVIFGANGLQPDNIRSINTNSPYIIDKIMEYKKNIWNEFLTFLGINNLFEKKERLVAEETNTNNEVININLQSFMKPRQLACEYFNKLYGLTGDKAVSIKLRSDLLNTIKSTESIITSTQTQTESEETDGNI